MDPYAQVLLSTAYLGPVRYFSKIAVSKKAVVEKYGNFVKQTYRNRCVIAGPNGPQVLTVPVKKGSFHKTAERELEIEYNKTWQNLHWRTLRTAYRSSPYFEFYEDSLRPFYEKKTRFLLDLNMEISRILLSEMDISTELVFSSSFLPAGQKDDTNDFREGIRPKNPPADPEFHPAPYIQVFRDRYSFLPDLSIVDLLFNLGPDSAAYLRKCKVSPDQEMPSSALSC